MNRPRFGPVAFSAVVRVDAEMRPPPRAEYHRPATTCCAMKLPISTTQPSLAGCCREIREQRGPAPRWHPGICSIRRIPSAPIVSPANRVAPGEDDSRVAAANEGSPQSHTGSIGQGDRGQNPCPAPRYVRAVHWLSTTIGEVEPARTSVEDDAVAVAEMSTPRSAPRRDIDQLDPPVQPLRSAVAARIV